jgi:hypothetical protein
MDTTLERATVIDWSPAWSAGTPFPQVFSNGHETYLMYYVEESDPEWDGSYTTLINPSSESIYTLAVVEFIHPHSHRFGIVNDEAAEGHPLYEKGMKVYAAHKIENSSWITELKAIHKVHPYFSELKWSKYNHYLLFFHDEIFEIIATDYRIQLYKSAFKDLAIRISEFLNR